MRQYVICSGGVPSSSAQETRETTVPVDVMVGMLRTGALYLPSESSVWTCVFRGRVPSQGNG